MLCSFAQWFLNNGEDNELANQHRYDEVDMETEWYLKD
jgi:hypothetical protein